MKTESEVREVFDTLERLLQHAHRGPVETRKSLAHRTGLVRDFLAWVLDEPDAISAQDIRDFMEIADVLDRHPRRSN